MPLTSGITPAAGGGGGAVTGTGAGSWSIDSAGTPIYTITNLDGTTSHLTGPGGAAIVPVGALSPPLPTTTPTTAFTGLTDQGPGTWSPLATTESYTIRVITLAAAITFADDDGNTVTLQNGESFSWERPRNATTTSTAPVLTVGAGSLVRIVYART